MIRNSLRLESRLLLALALIGIGATGKLLLGMQVNRVRDRETASITRSLASFPQRLGEWTSIEVPTDEKMLRDIKSNDHLHREYLHPNGERVELWLNYSSRSLDQYHYPSVCMKGAGWDEDESRRSIREIELGADSKISIHQLYYSKDEDRSTVFYWYYLIGEDPIDRAMRGLSQYARVFLRGRQNPSLTVELFSYKRDPDQKRLLEFNELVAKELSKWMPAGTESSAELGATY